MSFSKMCASTTHGIWIAVTREGVSWSERRAGCWSGPFSKGIAGNESWCYGICKSGSGEEETGGNVNKISTR